VNSGNPDPVWALEVLRLHAAVRSIPSGRERDGSRGDLWRLLFESLMRYLRGQSRSFRNCSVNDLEDIAAEKALEILGRAESGAWDLSDRSAAEVSGYIAKVARNGWLDFVKRAAREVRMNDDDSPEPDGNGLPKLHAERGTTPSDLAESAELANAVRECAARLPERERRVWFFRAYYDMSSREIAAHPAVALKPAHVDVIAQRARDALRDCLRSKGHEGGDAPAGAFVEIWEQLESMARREPVEAGAVAGATGVRKP
jgi:RNA polymerase sigma factor (sigma-70 family)